MREGPFKIIAAPDALPVRDEDTKEILKFASVADCQEAIKVLGYNYWWPSRTKPDNWAYEQAYNV